MCNNLTIPLWFLQEFQHSKERPWLCIWFYRKRHIGGIRRGTLRGKSYPFIMTEGSSVSTQAAELTKRFSGGRAEFFPAIFLETTVTTQGAWQQQRKSLMSWYNNPLWLTKIQPEPTAFHRSHIQCIASASCLSKLFTYSLNFVELHLEKKKLQFT